MAVGLSLADCLVHRQYAIKCQGKPSALHRDSDDATAHRNANACRSPNRCSGNPDTSNSCVSGLGGDGGADERRLTLVVQDEYPFASSEEGGAGAVTRCVPAHENSVQVRSAKEGAARLGGSLGLSGWNTVLVLHTQFDW